MEQFTHQMNEAKIVLSSKKKKALQNKLSSYFYTIVWGSAFIIVTGYKPLCKTSNITVSGSLKFFISYKQHKTLNECNSTASSLIS